MCKLRSWQSFFKQQRRRLASLFLVIGVIVLGHVFFGAWPRECAVRFKLSPGLRAADSLRIRYTADGEVISSIHLNFPDAEAPEQVAHRPTLAQGRYEVDVDVALRDGTVSRHHRILIVPYDGVMRFRLEAAP